MVTAGIVSGLGTFDWDSNVKEVDFNRDLKPEWLRTTGIFGVKSSFVSFPDQSCQRPLLPTP